MLLLLLACFPQQDKGDPLDTGRPAGSDSGDDDTGASDSGDSDTGDSDTGDTTIDDPVDEDDDGFTVGEGDCDDANPDANPDAVEICNEVDDDCDQDVDEGLTATMYPDGDGDGYGRNGDEAQRCPDAAGFSDVNTDCDDTDATIHPGATDDSNGVDDDCDGSYDEDAAPRMITVTVDWTTSGVSLAITGAPPGYDFGMAETGAGAAGWYGETCIPGPEPGGGDDYGFDLCHAMGATGGSLPSVSSLSDVSDTNTLFNESIGDRGDITYMLADTATLDCWVWGDDPSYYADLYCTVL